MKKQLFAERRPYLYVALIEVVVVLVYLLVRTIAHFLQLSNQGLYGLANLGRAVIVAVLLTTMRWWQSPWRWRSSSLAMAYS